MEDTDFEEGEACSYQYDEQTNIDLDALTYIDEKLQNVLGHLKKDFEGGVSSENLGTKYGGYGSFLTQPVPLSSNSRSPMNFQDNHSHKSATCQSFEGGNYSSLSRSNGNHFPKHESGSVRSASSELYKAPSVHDSVRQIVQAPLKHSTEESTAKLEVVDKINNMNEHKTLKVRIKVSSDNLSAKKNTEIYSGLGLVSPSSSFDDSPIRNEGLSEGLQFPGDESPTQIIRIMTSFPIYGGQPLSPLPEGLARLTAKLLQGNKVEPAFWHSRDNSVMRSNRKSAKKLSVEDSLKSGERDHLSPEHKGGDGKALYGVNVIVNNQADLNTEACVVLVSEALKLPLLSDLHGPSEEKRDTSKQKSNLLPNVVKGEPLVPISNSDGNCDEKQISKENVAVEVADDEKVDLLTDVPSYPKKHGDGRGEAANSSTIANGNDVISKSRRASISGLCSFKKEKNVKKYATTVEQDGKNLPSGREQLPLGNKKKHEGNQFIGLAAAEIHKDSIGHAVSGNRDSSTPPGTFPKQKDKTKARDKYKDFFGEMNENGDDLMDYLDEPSNGKLKTSQINEQGLLSCDNNVRERSENGAHEQLMLKVDSKRALHFAPPSDRVPPSGDPASAAAPVEDWVQCDKCLKWRLIPFGTKVDSLPEKWLCSMLDWLPGMNSCNITEEETTKAVTLLYQSQIRVGLHGSLEAVVPGVTAPSNLHRTQTQRDIFRGGDKKHNGLKEVPNSKQELLHSVKDASLSNGVGSDLESGMHLQHFRNPIDSVLEANQPKKKSKKKKLDSYSDGGHSNCTKIGGQREPDQDYARVKKMKTEDDGWMSTHGLLTNHASSARNKVHTDDSLQSSINRSTFQPQAFPHAGCLDARDVNNINLDTKKRKVKSSIDVSPSILSVNMVNDSEQMGQKKARMSFPEEKASSSSQGKGRTDKRRKGPKGHRLGRDVGSTLILDDRGSLKRESGSGATSSCSKILDSQKSKSISQKVKSSPVRSLSSSPFRTTNVDMLALGRKKLPDDSGDVLSGAMKKILSGKNRIDGFLVDDKVQNKISLGLPSHILAASQAYTLDQHNLCTSEAPEAPVEDGSLNQPVKSVCNDNGFLPRHSAKVVASLSKDKDRICKPEFDKSKVKICESYDDSRDLQHIVKDKTRCIKSKFQENSGCIGDEMDFGGKKSSSGIMLDEASKENGKLKAVGQVDPVIKADSVAKKKINTDCGEKICKSIDQDKDEEMGLHSEKEKSGNKGDGSNNVPLPYQGSVADVHDGGKGLKEQSSTKKSDTQNGIHSSTSKHPLSNVRKFKDRDTPSPMRRDSHNQAAINALKEAKDLKHLADRKKNSGSPMSTGLYFEATLTFLHAACLFESSGSENSKRGDIMQSMQVYSSTAKLCEFCAHEYEKSKDLASAALAYKCMEVAYLRVIYSSHPAANRDRHELQNSLQMIPPGESPSSSASDIDNASTAAEKAAQVRDGNSPQTAGNHVIAARSRPIFLRFLNFMQDVNFAMEASRKSQGAFAAAKAAMQQNDSKEGIASIKRVLDFNFHDVNGLLRLVRLAMEAIKL